jgi:hypothetical protein
VKPDIDSFDDPALDELLAQARWPEPSFESTERLRRQWGALRQPRVGRPLAWAVAAGILIAIGSAATSLMLSRDIERPAQVVHHAPVMVEAPAAAAPRIASREATLQERLALLSASSAVKVKPPVPAPAAAPPKQDLAAAPSLPHESVRAVITRARIAKSDDARAEAVGTLLVRGNAESIDAFLSLVLDPATRTSALAALHGAPDGAAEALLAALDHRRVDYRLAAAKSLGSMCEHGGVGARLQQMVRENDNRREALAALVSCPGKPAADFLRAARFRPAIASEVRAVQSELANMFES